MSDLTGKQLEQYYLDRPLGRGSSATVYLARHVPTGQTCVLKVLLKPSDADMARRFREGGKFAAGLQHPNIIRVLRVGEDKGYSFVAMEYLPGGTLEVLLHGQPWLWEQAEPILRQVGAALDHAHERGIVHRDVKPSNILFAADHKRLVLSDFGIAQSLLRGQPSARPDRSGTLLYMSPEQCQGAAVGAASDIYSLAVMAYQMLTGRLPFQAEEPLALLRQQVSQPPPSPRSLNPNLKPHIEAALIRGLAKNPSERFGTAAEFVEAMDGNKAPVAEGQAQPNRGRFLAVLAIGAILIGIVLGMWAWEQFGSQATPTPATTVVAGAATAVPLISPSPAPTSTVGVVLSPSATLGAGSGPAATYAPTSTLAPAETATPLAPTSAPTTPTASLPLAVCSDPQVAQITSPRQGQVITGAIPVIGSATGPRFLRYEFDYRRPDEKEFHQYLGSRWTTPVVGGVLGEWNPFDRRLALAAGEYQLQLRVVDNTGNHALCVVAVIVR